MVEFATVSTDVAVTQRPITKGKASLQIALNASGMVAQGGVGGGYAALGAAIVMPVALIGGAIYGGVAGIAKSDLETSNAAIAAAVANFKLEDDLLRDLLQEVGRNPRGVQLIIPQCMNTTSLSGNSTKESTGPAVVAPQSSPEVEPAARLRVLVHRCALFGNPGINPALKFCLVVEGVLIRIGDESEAGRLFANFTSKPRRYRQWAQANAEALRVEWALASASIANQILDWLAGGPPPPAMKPPF